MESVKLYMVLLGCKPAGRNTEQHDVFFSIARQVKDIVGEIVEFWPEANQKIHRLQGYSQNCRLRYKKKKGTAA